MKHSQSLIFLFNILFSVGSTVFAATPLTLGPIYSGNISLPGETNAFTFTGVPGQRLYFDSQDADNLSLNATLFSPSGFNLYSRNDDYDSGPLVLTEPGTYTLVLDGSAATTGTYQFRLLDLSAAPPLTLGSTLSGQLSPALACNIYQFTGVRGQRIRLQTVAYSSTQVQWQLVSPANAILATGQIYQDLGTVTLPLDGEYCLLVSGTAAGSSPLTFQVLATDVSDASATASGFGTAYSGTVSANLTNSFTYTAPAGLPVYFDSLDTSGQSLVVDLMDPFGNPVFSVGEISDAGPYILPRSGTYTLNVRGPGGSSGNFNFRLLDLTSSPALALNTAVSNVLAVWYQSDVLKFSGTAGQRLIYDSLDSTFVNVQVRLLSADGQGVFGGSTSSDYGPMTLPYSGTYYLLFQSGAATSTTYNFQLIDINSQPALPLNVDLVGTLAVNTSLVYQVAGNVGEQLYFNGKGVNAGGAYWTLYDPKNSGIASAGLGSDFEVTLAYAGNYVLQLVAGSTIINYSNQVNTFAFTTNTLALGTAVTNTIFNPGDQIYYTFTGAAGQRLYYDALTPIYLSINATLFSPSGAAVATGNASGDFGPVTLPVSGTYTVLFDGGGDTVGGINFQLLDAGAQPALPLNIVLSNTLPANNTIIYQLAGTKGQQLYFNGQPVTVGGATWALYGPNNLYVNSSGLAGDFELSLPSAGNYMLVIAAGGNAVSFTNEVDTFAYSTNALTLATALTNNIVHPGDQVLYTFNGTAGQRVYLDSLAANYLSINATLISPNGAGLAFGNASYDLGPVTLPQTGTYGLLFDGSGDTTGGISFQLLDVGVQPALPLNSDLSGTLAPNTSILYQLAATKGEQLYFNANSVSAGGASWTLFGPNNLSFNGTGLGGDFEVTLPSAGNYVLVLGGGPNPVAYTNQVYAFGFQTNALTLGAAVTTTLVKPGDQFFYTFTGSAGQRVYYDSRQTNYNNAYVTLVSPTGVGVFSGNSIYDLGPYTLTQNGTYTLVIDGSGDATGTVAFNLLDLAAALPVTLGNSINGSLADQTETRLYRFAGTAGQRVNLQGLSAAGSLAIWELIGLDDQILGSTPRVDANIGTVTLPATGTYTVEVIGSGMNTSPVPYQLTLTDVSDSSSPVSGFGTVHSGTIGANQTNSFTITAPAGLPIFFDGEDTSGQSLIVDLISPDSTAVFSINETADSGPYVLPRSGVYTVNVRGPNGSSGNFSFRILDLTTSPTLTLNTVVNSSLNDPYETDVYQFTSSAGQQLIYDAVTNDVSFPSVYALLLDPRWLTVGVNGIDFQNDRGPFTVSYAGTCYLFFRNSRSVASTYSFRLLDISSQAVLPLNSAVTNTLDVYPIGIYRYSGTASQQLYFRANQGNPSGYWTLYDPNNNNLSGSPALTSDLEVTLPVSGTYSLVLNSYSTGPSTDIFQMSDFSYVTNAYTIGTPVVDALGRPGERRYYTFAGSLGQRLVYDALTNDPPDGSLITVQLLNPQGAQEGPIGGRFSTDRGPFTLQQSGTYTLVVDGNGSGVGPIAFELLDVSAQPVLPINTSVTNTLGVYPLEVYKYNGTAGQQLYFRALSGNPSGYWALYDPNNNSVPSGYSGLTSDMEVTLPLSGTYTLLVSSYSTSAGAESFRVNDFSFFTNGYTIGTPLVDSIQRPGETRSYTFTGTLGQRLFYDALTNDPPDGSVLTAQLLNPQGVQEGPISGRFSNDRGPFTLQQSGTYTLVVDGYLSGTGTFAFQLLDVAAQPVLPIGIPVTNILGDAIVAYRYAGTAGEHLYFHPQSSNAGGIWVLYDPNDTYVSGAYVGLSSDMEVTLPLNGTYVLVLSAYPGSGGAHVFQVNRFNFGETVLINRAPVLSHIGSQATGEGQALLFTAQASDPDGNSLTFSLDAGAPGGASINPTTGSFTWTPVLTGYSFVTNLTVRVTDNGVPKLSAAESISVEVIAGPVMLTVHKAAGSATVFWRTAPGKHYQLQFKNLLTEATWTDIGTVLSATDFVTSEIDTTIGSNGQRYYRVHLLDP